MKTMKLGMLTITVATSIAASAAELWISPGPNALEKARDEVRRMRMMGNGAVPKDGVVIHLEDGVYEMEKPLTLSTEDSGDESAPIVWRAVNRGRAVITGRDRVKEVAIDWSVAPASRIPAASRPKVRCWQLPGDKPLPGFYAGGCCVHNELDEKSICVFSGGERAIPARWPNADYARTGQPVGKENDAVDSFGKKIKKINTGIFHTRNAPLAAWAEETDLWAYGSYGQEWSVIISPVLKADVIAGTLSVEPSKNKYGFKPNMPYFVLNSFADLDSEGEWAIDRKNRRVYLWGRDDETPAVALADTLVCGDKVSHVTFDGIVFETVRDTALKFFKANGVKVRASCVRMTGGNGIEFKKSVNCSVVGCDLYDLGKAGVYVEGGNELTLTPGNNLVDNCHIHHWGRIIPCYNPGVSLHGCGNRATHNLIHHSPHQAIYFNGNDHYIGFNILHDCCTYTDDAGTIYCCMRNWMMRGTVVEYNTIHMTGMQPLAKHVRGIYLDDWSSGMIVRGNIINRAPEGIYAGGGHANVIARNVVINAPFAVSIGTRGLDSFARETTKLGDKSYIYRKYMDGKRIWSNPPWVGRYPYLAELEKLPTPIDAHLAIYNEVSNNVCVATKGVRLDNAAAVGERKTIADNYLVDGDPGFVDYAGFNWELKPDSPARKVLGGGTRFAEMGLYASDDRFSPAVKHGSDMTPPRPFGYELEPAQPTVFLAVDKHKLVSQKMGAVFGDWVEFEIVFTPDVTGSARLRFTQHPDRARTEYAQAAVNGTPLTGPDDNMLFDVTNGVEMKLTFKARAASH